MREEQRSPSRIVRTFLVAPTLARARAAISELSGPWEGALEPATLTGFLARRRSTDVLLCPEGGDIAGDLEFLREARGRMLWRAPDEDLRAAIAGLRGEEIGPLSGRVPREAQGGRRLALLLEGVVDGRRARRALASDLRLWIVESPFAVRLNARERARIAEAGVTWSALAPVRVAALVASPRLARARRLWRGLLPPRTRVIVIDSRG